jgi:hypothetical protein
MYAVWIPFLMLSISHCDMLSSSFNTQVSHGNNFELRTVFQRHRLKCDHEQDNKAVIRASATLCLRGGGSDVVGRLKDFQTKASLILRSVGGTMNSSAFAKRWTDVFVGDDLQRSLHPHYQLATNWTGSDILTRYLKEVPSRSVGALMQQCGTFSVRKSSLQVIYFQIVSVSK